MDTFFFIVISATGVIFLAAFSLISTFYKVIRNKVLAARSGKTAARKGNGEKTQGSESNAPKDRDRGFIWS